MKPATLSQAFQIISDTPGYSSIGADLMQLDRAGRIRVDRMLEDRAQTSLRGFIILGPEAVEASPLSLAQTLVHEHFHLRHQHPLLKTVSFWSGVLNRTPVMRRYEQPAYQAAMNFLEAVKHAHPLLAEEAKAEQHAIQQVFQMSFKAALSKP